MKKASKRRILFAARMATMVGAACFAVSGISETLGQEKEKSRPVYIATEEVAETTYAPEVEEATQPTETAKAVETEEPLIASMDWDKDDSYLLWERVFAEIGDVGEWKASIDVNAGYKEAMEKLATSFTWYDSTEEINNALEASKKEFERIGNAWKQYEIDAIGTAAKFENLTKQISSINKEEKTDSL